jgi:hypothetical protein
MHPAQAEHFNARADQPAKDQRDHKRREKPKHLAHLKRGRGGVSGRPAPYAAHTASQPRPVNRVDRRKDPSARVEFGRIRKQISKLFHVTARREFAQPPGGNSFAARYTHAA